MRAKLFLKKIEQARRNKGGSKSSQCGLHGDEELRKRIQYRIFLLYVYWMNKRYIIKILVIFVKT